MQYNEMIKYSKRYDSRYHVYDNNIKYQPESSELYCNNYEMFWFDHGFKLYNVTISF